MTSCNSGRRRRRPGLSIDVTFRNAEKRKAKKKKKKEARGEVCLWTRAKRPSEVGVQDKGQGQGEDGRVIRGVERRQAGKQASRYGGRQRNRQVGR